MGWAIAGIGLQLLGMWGNKRSSDRAAAEARKQRLDEIKRQKYMSKARRSLGLVQRQEGYRLNLLSASNAISGNSQKYQALKESVMWKEFQLYRKTSATKGTAAAAGMTGKSAKRWDAVRDKVVPGIAVSQMAQQLASKRWELNREREDIWMQYEDANKRVHDDSDVGRLQTIGSAPRRPANRWVSYVAGGAGIIGDYMMNKYQAQQSKGRDYYGTSPSPTSQFNFWSMPSNYNTYWNVGNSWTPMGTGYTPMKTPVTY